MNSIISFCAQYLYLVLGLGAAAYWIMLSNERKLKVIIYGVMTGVIAYILARVGSMLYNNPRPFVVDHVAPLFQHAADNGFPSDHTLITAAIAMAIFAVSKKWGLVLLLGSVIVGYSRVLAHVHHVLDILGSLAFVGIGYIAACYLGPWVLKRAVTLMKRPAASR